jgi:hypothetical protein
MQIQRAPQGRSKRWMMTIGITVATSLITSAWAIVPGKVLFDATKAEMCANADWVIDADTYNIGTGSTGLMVVGSGSEANPGRYPTPAASGITASTSETYWKGALSAWAVSLVKLGFSVETLPVTGRITYGDSTNAQDLSNYGIYIVTEPNIKFTTAEKQAHRERPALLRQARLGQGWRNQGEAPP